VSRSKNYKESQVLHKAMLAFWQNGYDGTTTRKLAETMGINQYSVYSSFKSKRNLFEKALDHYFETVIKDGVASTLNQENLSKQNLVEFLNQFTLEFASYPQGCFICNTMIDTNSHGPNVNMVLQKYTKFIKNAIARIVKFELPSASQSEMRQKSSLLYTALLGLGVQKRMGESEKVVSTNIVEMLALLNP